MPLLTMVAALALFIYGWTAAGIVGAVTAGTTAFLAGTGFQLVLRPSSPGMLPQPLVGLGLALITIVASLQGGWRWGWLWAIGGYLAGVLAAMFINIALVRSRH